MEVKRQMAAPSPMWTRSTFCADSACVEVASLDDGNVGLRDSKSPEQPHLTFEREAWNAFLDDLATGALRDI